MGLALVLAGAAWADIDVDNEAQGWTEPTREVQVAHWPRDANGQLIYGEVLLDCAVASGHAAECKVKASEPANALLEQAALALAPLFTSTDKSQARRLLELSILYDTPPDWLKKPNFNDLMAAYPRQAFKQGVSGGAVIRCIVQRSGLLRACSVTKEDRPGLGFGPAAVVLSRTFLFKPATRAGQPVEAEVTIPINFKLSGQPGPRPPSSPPATVLGEAIWSKTPTVADILAEISKKVGDKFAEGQVVLQCRLDKKSAKLSACVVANVSPGMAQFRSVAQSLIPRFQADPNVLATANGDVFVNLAFAFPDMSSPEWDKRYLTHPKWTKVLDADPNISTFPKAAIKAGLTTGSATVDCLVAPNGALTQCMTVRESTPNVGFGDTAIKIAETFVANPWEEDGLPVDGAHVRMPIQMEYDPSTAVQRGSSPLTGTAP